MNLTTTTAAGLVPLHLGALHPVEQLLTVLLAFGPFVLLGVVIAVRRRQDAREETLDEARDGGLVDGVEAGAGEGDRQPPVTPGQRER